MSNLDKQNINVLNYNENDIFSDTMRDHYKFSASRDGITPSVTPIPLNELLYISSNTEAISSGWLMFDDDVKEEIYKELRIYNWENILSNKDIEDIIMNPTIEGLQKIIDIDNPSYFDRVRVALFKLIEDGKPVTEKVNRIIDQRYDEIQKRQRRSSIILTKKDETVPTATAEEVKALSEQNANLQEQLNAMKAMMEQMMAAQTQKTETKTEQKNNAPKKPGRPPKNK